MERVARRARLWILLSFGTCVLAVPRAHAQQGTPQETPATVAEPAPTGAPAAEPAPAPPPQATPAATPASAPPPTTAPPPLVPVVVPPPAPPPAPPPTQPAADDKADKPAPPFLAQGFLLRAELGLGYGRAHDTRGPDGNGFIGGFTLSVGGFVAPRLALHADFAAGGTTSFHYQEHEDFERVSGTTSFWGYAGGGATVHVGTSGLLLSGGIGVSGVSTVEWTNVDQPGSSYTSHESEWSNPGFTFTLAVAKLFAVRPNLGVGVATRYYFAHYGPQNGDIVQLEQAHLLTVNFALTFNPQPRTGS